MCMSRNGLLHPFGTVSLRPGGTQLCKMISESVGDQMAPRARYIENYNKALQDRNIKTGLWLVEDSSEYARWKTTQGSFLWPHGIPRCGKTILNSTVLQNVLNEYSVKPTSAVLFFYFDFTDDEKQRHQNMVRSLICQLSEHCASPVLQNLYSVCSNGSRQPTEEELLNTLYQMITCLEDTTLFLMLLMNVEIEKIFSKISKKSYHGKMQRCIC